MMACEMSHTGCVSEYLVLSRVGEVVKPLGPRTELEEVGFQRKPYSFQHNLAVSQHCSLISLDENKQYPAPTAKPSPS